jgi:hypothetical protein
MASSSSTFHFSNWIGVLLLDCCPLIYACRVSKYFQILWDVDIEFMCIMLLSGHSSMIYFVEDVEASPAAQNLALRDLPLRDVGQHFLFC